MPRSDFVHFVLIAAALLVACDDSPSSTSSNDADDLFRPPEDVSLDTGVATDTEGRDSVAGDSAADSAAVDTQPTDTSAGDTGETGDTGDTGVAVCPDPGVVFTGVHILDEDGDPMLVNDRLIITVEVMGTSSAESATLEIVTGNIRTHAATIEKDGVPVADAIVAEPRISIPMNPTEPAVYTFVGFPTSLSALVTVFAEVRLTDSQCTVHRSASAAMLQVAGGHTKTALCVDMEEVRSLQVAPSIALRSTAEYLGLNGARTDLEARNFIFCPQNPTIVHVTDFCLQTAAGQQVSLAGSYRSEGAGGTDGSWEVDDFILFEVFQGAKIADGFTTQQHSGGDTFWCSDTSEQLCSGGCTAELYVAAEDRNITPIAVATAEGADARKHIDGAVVLDDLIGTDGFSGTVIVTALDQGIEGTLQPVLYLTSTEP